MRAAEIEVGGRYVAKVSGVLVVVRVDDIGDCRTYRGLDWRGSKVIRESACYNVTNEKTGRER